MRAAAADETLVLHSALSHSPHFPSFFAVASQTPHPLLGILYVLSAFDPGLEELEELKMVDRLLPAIQITWSFNYEGCVCVYIL